MRSKFWLGKFSDENQTLIKIFVQVLSTPQTAELRQISKSTHTGADLNVLTSWQNKAKLYAPTIVQLSGLIL